MSLRPWLAIVLLLSYLMVVGIDCVNRPQDQAERVQIITSEQGQHYQQCRYMRMDGLESFVMESLASRCQSAPVTPPRHLISVVHAVSVHTLTNPDGHLLPPARQGTEKPVFSYQVCRSTGVRTTLIIPPRQA